MNLIIFADLDSSARSEQPVWIVLDSANPAQSADPHPVLPSIEYISLWGVTCSSTWLRNLFNTILTLDHEVVCLLTIWNISSPIKGVYSEFPRASIKTDVNKCLSIRGLNIIIPDLYNRDLKDQDGELLFESVQSLPQLETLNIDVNAEADISPNLWKGLTSLNIKRVTLSINSVWCGLVVNNVSMLSQALLSNNMETICIYLNVQPCMMEAMYGLPIKSLSMYGSGEELDINHLSSLNKLLSSLKQLEKLNVVVNNNIPGLWEALRGLNIKSLSLNGGIGCLIDSNVSWMSQLLSSLTQLETLSIGVNYHSSLLWKALRGLHIKRLCLSCSSRSMIVHDAELLSQSLSSLTQLEMLTLNVAPYIHLQLPQSLKFLNFYCTGISPLELRDLVKALSACTQTLESKLEFGCAKSFSRYSNSRIRPEEYFPIQQELTVQRNVEVKRFRLLDRKDIWTMVYGRPIRGENKRTSYKHEPENRGQIHDPSGTENPGQDLDGNQDDAACPSLTQVQNGAVVITTDGRLTSAAFSCNTGYQLTGSGTLTCTAAGSWDLSPPD